ncbi:hypothetical protein FEM48_Zijuj08G0029700 [Ziziphus jujuba var. spinosa]|uniref:Brix domain-containing protein n=1 Tax=Ziziphus jujuba var. spinosa TaxID=714518 RepID=A0A978UWL2_ZIZJJ|nr:hypothetical protein FEM48_Zijuj08G0029700 [Ziziphus jujuba var. spinosa]
MRMGWGGKWKHVFSMVVINFGFGLVNLLLKKALDQGLNHLVIVTYRQAISATFLFPIAYFWERKSRSELTPQILSVTKKPVFLVQDYALAVFISYWTRIYIGYVFMCIPQYGARNYIYIITAIWVNLEKVNMKSKSGTAKVLGSLLCVCGALLLTIYRGMPLAHSHSSATVVQENHHHMMISAKKTERWIVGSMFLGGGSLLWSSWFLIQARIGKKYPFQYTSTAILSFFSAVQSAILSLAIHRNISMWVLKGTLEIISVIYAGMVASGLCYVGMSWCINHKGPVFTAAFTPFTQIFVAIFDFSVLHEQIYLGSVLGSILVVIGMYILLWGKSKEAKECSVKQNQAAEEGEDCQPPVICNRGPAFISELLSVIPNAHYYKKGTYDLQKIVEYANKKDFTSIIVVHTNRREPDPTFSSLTILDALLIIGLPYGPTAHYKLSRLVSRMDIKNHGDPTSHEPELVLTNFVACLD